MTTDEKNLWTYWHQGFESAPHVVKRCVKKWQETHAGWTLHLLDEKSLPNFIDPVPIAPEKWEKMEVPHRSDLIRTQLLIKYGGVWVDPTCFPFQPLDTWLPEYMTSGLFLFANPGRDRIISNWFIAAEKGNTLLEKLYASLCQYWENNDFLNLGRKDTRMEKQVNRLINRNLDWPRLWFTWPVRKLWQRYPYMVYHYKFYDLIVSDPTCTAIWEGMPKFPAEIPHHIQSLGLLNKVQPETEALIRDKDCPIVKLSWKVKESEITEDSILEYLFAMHA